MKVVGIFVFPHVSDGFDLPSLPVHCPFEVGGFGLIKYCCKNRPAGSTRTPGWDTFSKQALVAAIPFWLWTLLLVFSLHLVPHRSAISVSSYVLYCSRYIFGEMTRTVGKHPARYQYTG